MSAILTFLFFAAAGGPGLPAPGLEAKIEALQAPEVAWRKIRWRSCLLDGLLEAERTRKPLLLWVFIDRPVDDARC